MEMNDPFHAPVAVTPGNNPRYELGRKLGVPQRQFECCGEGMNLFLMPGKDTNSSVVQPLA
jgi:hypothetical protein